MNSLESKTRDSEVLNEEQILSGLRFHLWELNLAFFVAKIRNYKQEHPEEETDPYPTSAITDALKIIDYVHVFNEMICKRKGESPITLGEDYGTRVMLVADRIAFEHPVTEMEIQMAQKCYIQILNQIERYKESS